MNKKYLEELRIKNYLTAIRDKVNKIEKEHEGDIDLMIKVVNGDFFDIAHQEFCNEKTQGLYDKLNIKIPTYDF